LYHYARYKLGLVRLNVSDNDLYNLALRIADPDEYKSDWDWCDGTVIDFAEAVIDQPAKLYELRHKVEYIFTMEMEYSRRYPFIFYNSSGSLNPDVESLHRCILNRLRSIACYPKTCISNRNYPDEFVYDIAFGLVKYSKLMDLQWEEFNTLVKKGFFDDLTLLPECKVIIEDLSDVIISEIICYQDHLNKQTKVRRVYSR
jgi:hypothetical protein